MLAIAQFESAEQQIAFYQALKKRLYQPAPLSRPAPPVMRMTVPAVFQVDERRDWVDTKVDHNSHVIRHRAAVQRSAQSGVFSKLLIDTSYKYGITPDDVLRKNRILLPSYARQEICWELRELGWSFPRIGASIGRDHTTAIYNTRAHEARMKDIPEGKEEIISFSNRNKRVRGVRTQLPLTRIIEAVRLYRAGMTEPQVAQEMQMTNAEVRFSVTSYLGEKKTPQE